MSPFILTFTIGFLTLVSTMIACLIFLWIKDRRNKSPKETQPRIPQAWLEDGRRIRQVPAIELAKRYAAITDKKINREFKKLENELDQAIEENPELVADMFSLYFADFTRFLDGIGITKKHDLYKELWHFKDKMHMLKNHWNRTEGTDTFARRGDQWNYGYYLILRPHLDVENINYNPDLDYYKIHQESIGTDVWKSRQYAETMLCVAVGLNSFNDFEKMLQTRREELNPKLRDISQEELQRMRDEFGSHANEL